MSILGDIGGAISSAASSFGGALGSAASDAWRDPFGAAGLALAVVSTAGAAGLVLGGGQVVLAGALVGDATGTTHGAFDSLVQGAEYAATHPGETGRAVVGGELAIAGHYAPGSSAAIGSAFNATAPSAAAPVHGQTAGPSSAPPPDAQPAAKPDFWERIKAFLREMEGRLHG